MRRICVFDLDGTLVDSVPDLAAALNRLMAARGLAGFDRAEVAAMVGDGVAVLVGRALAARGLPADPAAVAAFAGDYDDHAAEATRLYPGVAEGLAAMAASGWGMAVCTNKPAGTARRLLAALRIEDRFAAVGGGDSFPTRKPDPAHLLATLQAAGGAADRAVMVGDHRNDIAAAIGAGVTAIFAGWGYGSPAMADGAAAVADRFSLIPGLAATLLP